MKSILLFPFKMIWWPIQFSFALIGKFVLSRGTRDALFFRLVNLLGYGKIEHWSDQTYEDDGGVVVRLTRIILRD